MSRESNETSQTRRRRQYQYRKTAKDVNGFLKDIRKEVEDDRRKDREKKRQRNRGLHRIDDVAKFKADLMKYFRSSKTTLDNYRKLLQRQVRLCERDCYESPIAVAGNTAILVEVFGGVVERQRKARRILQLDDEYEQTVELCFFCMPVFSLKNLCSLFYAFGQMGFSKADLQRFRNEKGCLYLQLWQRFKVVLPEQKDWLDRLTLIKLYRGLNWMGVNYQDFQQKGINIDLTPLISKAVDQQCKELRFAHDVVIILKNFNEMGILSSALFWGIWQHRSVQNNILSNIEQYVNDTRRLPLPSGVVTIFDFFRQMSIGWADLRAYNFSEHLIEVLDILCREDKLEFTMLRMSHVLVALNEMQTPDAPHNTNAIITTLSTEVKHHIEAAMLSQRDLKPEDFIWVLKAVFPLGAKKERAESSLWQTAIQDQINYYLRRKACDSRQLSYILEVLPLMGHDKHNGQVKKVLDALLERRNSDSMEQKRPVRVLFVLQRMRFKPVDLPDDFLNVLLDDLEQEVCECENFRYPLKTLNAIWKIGLLCGQLPCKLLHGLINSLSQKVRDYCKDELITLMTIFIGIGFDAFCLPSKLLRFYLEEFCRAISHNIQNFNVGEIVYTLYAMSHMRVRWDGLSIFFRESLLDTLREKMLEFSLQNICDILHYIEVMGFFPQNVEESECSFISYLSSVFSRLVQTQAQVQIGYAPELMYAQFYWANFSKPVRDALKKGLTDEVGQMALKYLEQSQGQPHGMYFCNNGYQFFSHPPAGNHQELNPSVTMGVASQ